MNSDNGANIRRALLDMGKLEMTVEEEPLVVDDHEDEDDWTKVAKAESSSVTPAIDLTSVDFGPCPVSPQDEFHPVGLDEEQVWDSGDYTDVTHLISTLEDKVANIKANPRINNLQRLPCICHTLQVRTRFSLCDVFIISTLPLCFQLCQSLSLSPLYPCSCPF